MGNNFITRLSRSHCAFSLKVPPDAPSNPNESFSDCDMRPVNLTPTPPRSPQTSSPSASPERSLDEEPLTGLLSEQSASEQSAYSSPVKEAEARGVMDKKPTQSFSISRGGDSTGYDAGEFTNCCPPPNCCPLPPQNLHFPGVAERRLEKSSSEEPPIPGFKRVPSLIMPSDQDELLCELGKLIDVGGPPGQMLPAANAVTMQNMPLGSRPPPRSNAQLRNHARSQLCGGVAYQAPMSGQATSWLPQTQSMQPQLAMNPAMYGWSPHIPQMRSAHPGNIFSNRAPSSISGIPKKEVFQEPLKEQPAAPINKEQERDNCSDRPKKRSNEAQLRRNEAEKKRIRKVADTVSLLQDELALHDLDYNPHKVSRQTVLEMTLQQLIALRVEKGQKRQPNEPYNLAD